MSTKKTVYTIKNFREVTKNNNDFKLNKNKEDEYILHYAKIENKIYKLIKN